MLLHCLSGLSACSQISQSWYSPWHTNAARPRLAETKILTFSILMWPRQQKATSQPADKPQCLFLSPKPFCLPLKEQRLLRTGQAVALRVRHCPPQRVPPLLSPTQTSLCLNTSMGAAGSPAGHSLLKSFSIPAQAPVCLPSTQQSRARAILSLWDCHRPSPGLYDALGKDKTTGTALCYRRPIWSLGIQPLQLPPPGLALTFSLPKFSGCLRPGYRVQHAMGGPQRGHSLLGRNFVYCPFSHFRPAWAI